MKIQIRNKSLISIVGFTILAVIAVGLAVFTPIIELSPALQAQTDKPTVFLSDTDPISGVQYGLVYADGQLNGAVTYDYSSMDGILKYVAFNRRTIERLLKSQQKEFRALVVFNRPLAQPEFEQFIASYKMEPYAYTLRAVSPDGMRTTIYGAPVNGELVPMDLMNLITNDVKQRDGTALRGWIDVSAKMPRKALTKLLKDNRVYTVDLTESVMLNSITTVKLDAANASQQLLQDFARGKPSIQVSRVPLYWSLEDFGLVSSQ